MLYETPNIQLNLLSKYLAGEPRRSVVIVAGEIQTAKTPSKLNTQLTSEHLIKIVTVPIKLHKIITKSLQTNYGTDIIALNNNAR